MQIRPFEPQDIPAARALWERCEGVGLGAADEPDALEAFLARNPGLSFVAVDGSRIVATILCGHDGRRGLIHHLATAPSHRRRGIAGALLRKALAALEAAGIGKCHLMVFRDNGAGAAFWRKVGAEERAELSLFSLWTGERR